MHPRLPGRVLRVLARLVFLPATLALLLFSLRRAFGAPGVMIWSGLLL